MIAHGSARIVPLLLALAAGCKEKTYSQMTEACKSDEDCASGLLCVDGLGGGPQCMQACGEHGYGDCPDDWTCVGKAYAVIPESALSGRSISERRVCVRGEKLPPHPDGWWIASIVTPEPASDGDIGPGTAFRFVEFGYDLVLPSGVYDRRFVAWATGVGGWTAKGRYEETLVKTGDDLLLGHPFGSIGLIRADDARARELDAVLANAPTIKDGCARAQRCCEQAAEALDTECDVKAELGDGRWLRQCLNAIEGFRAVLAEAGKPIPESCAP